MPTLLVLIDVPNWCYANRARALARYAPPGWDVVIACWPDLREVPPHDIVFNLDSSVLKRFSDNPHVLSWNSDANRRRERWARTHPFADWIICNNLAAYHSYGPAERTCAISNGVDTEIFRVTNPISDRPDRVFWTGSSNPEKKKGFEILEEARPELERRGFEIAAFPVESVATAEFDTAGMVEQYNRSGYVLCLSESEATPNIVTEGAACGCAVVSTQVGNVMEWGTPGLDWMPVESRTPQGVIDALCWAREHRYDLATDSHLLISHRWSYGPPGNRAQMYFALFRALIAGQKPRPFSYTEVSPEEIG